MRKWRDRCAFSPRTGVPIDLVVYREASKFSPRTGCFAHLQLTSRRNVFPTQGCTSAISVQTSRTFVFPRTGVPKAPDRYQPCKLFSTHGVYRHLSRVRSTRRSFPTHGGVRQHNPTTNHHPGFSHARGVPRWSDESANLRVFPRTWGVPFYFSFYFLRTLFSHARGVPPNRQPAH